MNKKSLFLIWSLLCVPFILFIAMDFGYTPNVGVRPVFLWVQLVFVLSGIFSILQITINHLGLKILAVGLYIFGLLFFWLAIGMTVGCNNGGGCFVH